MIGLNLEQIYGGNKGALVYGTISSMNALIVTIGTPIFTMMVTKVRDISKLFIGLILLVVSYTFFVFEHSQLSFYYIHTFIFTIGEIVNTLGTQPYLTCRIPATLRGRISSISRVAGSLSLALSQYVIGYCIDHFTITSIWSGVIIVGIVGITLLYVLKIYDKKEYPLLYK